MNRLIKFLWLRDTSDLMATTADVWFWFMILYFAEIAVSKVFGVPILADIAVVKLSVIIYVGLAFMAVSFFDKVGKYKSTRKLEEYFPEKHWSLVKEVAAKHVDDGIGILDRMREVNELAAKRFDLSMYR